MPRLFGLGLKSKTKVRLLDSLLSHAHSASSASAEPAAAVAHGLQVVAEGTNPSVNMLLAARLRVRS
ncbi:hypothetical protein HBH98_248980 [Parastagonospora nodorum]|nr:hypothetical protein HBH53_253200 [Parastagonospora nodorum]KAH4215341.1 hypothetical protein HBI06_256000 [Parastagonospora nodorum]KAH4222574.1 hypothetical protein HBI05_253340 [Parastagonospora nodorum]KAH4333476.1 hypothetical protein HBH98_248980 [Parastagonospora nodorum]KAH4354527.1 hypothetical protein HBH97_247140 [Parastagonospora nodorum]